MTVADMLKALGSRCSGFGNTSDGPPSPQRAPTRIGTTSTAVLPVL
jgi:hypothetical protein